LSGPAKPFRVIDTGLRDGRANIAFDQALIDAHKAGRIPDTIRFLRFRPAALVGVHQILSHEVRLDYCRRRGIQVGRRITGGGGLYLDPGQIGWELVFRRDTLGINDLGELTRRICEAAALGLRKLGVPAAYRPRNDIEVDGRKICGTGGIFDGSTLFFQGTLLIDFDPADMIAALKVPVEKLAKRDLDSARQRVITLRDVLGARLPDLPAIFEALLAGFAEGLGIAPGWGDVTGHEEELARRLHDDEIGTDGFVDGVAAPEAEPRVMSASHIRRGGSLRADIRLAGANADHIGEALITGDFFVAPPRAILDLEASLRGVPVAAAGKAVDDFFARAPVEMLGLTPGDFRGLIEAALGQATIAVDGGALRGHWLGPKTTAAPTLVFLHDSLGCARLWRDFPERLARATGLRALVFDRLGSGDSPALSPPYSPSYLLDEGLRVLPRVRAAAGLGDIVLVGHSDGASIALAHAGAFPDGVLAVVALAPHLFREDKTLAQIAKQIADYEHGDLKARLARYHGGKTEALFGRLVEVWTGPGRRDWGLDSYLRRIRCPVLAMQGSDDEFFSAVQIETLDATVPGGVATMYLPGCGHALPSQAPRPIAAAAAQFIAEALARGARQAV
jgi:lipoate---protein ligase